MLLHQIERLKQAAERPLGNFQIELGDFERPPAHNFTSLGLIINNIVASCTFRPHASHTSLKRALRSLEIRNAFLSCDERFVDPRNPPPLEGPISPEKHALYQDILIWNKQVEEYNQCAKNFNPIGGLFVASALAILWMKWVNWSAQTLIPKAFKEESIFVGKSLAVLSLGSLTLEAVRSWAEHSEGFPRKPNASCRDH